MTAPAPHPATPPPLPAAAWPVTDRLRPLAELPAGRLARVVGVLTDIDDTLTRDGAIEPAALAALRALADAGVPVVAITGRPVGWSLPMARAWPVAAIVAENGAVMLRRGPQGACAVPSSPDQPDQPDQPGAGLRLDHVADAATRAAHRRRLDACAAAVLAQVPGACLAQDSAGRLTDIAIDHSEHAHLDEAQIARVLALMHAHGLTATVSSIHINGWIGGHDKLSGAQWAVREALGRPWVPEDWVFVGDSPNDQRLFASLPLSVGVANIARFVPQLQAWPGWVTTAERGQGFAELAQALLVARQGTRSPA